jgi:anaerobic selenocysteine-containing dehydrogenase
MTLIAKEVLKEGKKLLPYKDTADIREEMERTVPLYQGISTLKKEGDWIQWGGERLFEGGQFAKMPEGKARLWIQDIPKITIPEGHFHLTTRRGKQFNSMIFRNKDPLTGNTGRTTVFLHKEDASTLGVQNGDPVRIISDIGEMEAVVKKAPVRQKTVQTFWPEANVLLPRTYDPISGEPDYNVFVRVEPL